jgi:predicted RNA-binding protein with TRAM domain
MEFSINCPIDGTVTVSIEDIETVVLREPERADITFVCPHCGTIITVQAVIPTFLVAAIEALADTGDGQVPVSGLVALVSGNETDFEPDEPIASIDDPVAEAYCEYFRRQLDHVECVDDALAEMDAPGIDASS